MKGDLEKKSLKHEDPEAKSALWILCFVLLFFASISHAESTEGSNEEHGFSHYLLWPFSHVIQPVLNAVVYPVSAPLHYAFDNGVIENAVDLISYGERKQIMVYPVMNLKPGSRTMLGANYRHRSMIFNKDYTVLEAQYYANGDWYVSTRYSKQELFGLPMFGAFRFRGYWNRDDVFIVPGTKEQFTQPDSSRYFDFRIGAPLTSSRKLNAEMMVSLEFVNGSVPDVLKDSILWNEKFPIEDRGLYQHFRQIPVSFSLLYDDLDFAYAPSKGRRIELSGQYYFVGKYEGLDLDRLGPNNHLDGTRLSDGGLNHDYIRSQLMFQHYFYLGKAKQFHLSVKEARQSRRFYTDFSWDEALRIWHPNNVRETLFERRVLAFQFRMLDMWEMEKGGAPYKAYNTMSARLPLRGYANPWSAAHIMSFSAEYRWPIDRFVDGVLFDEYGLHAESPKDWSMDRFYNSWGFGVRVRSPDMYFFRLQVGFHGLQGVNLVMTIAPEFQ